MAVIDPEHFSVQDYLGKQFCCDCGKSHTTELGMISIGSGAIHDLPDIIRRLHCKCPFIICDQNTWAVAGERVESLARHYFPQSSLHRLESRDVVPDETTLGELLMACPAQSDIIIGVGTGTINDLSKYLSFRLKLPYIIVATAPSMDGFASVGAALITDSLKTTYDAHVPNAIIGDLDILATAPQEMIVSGLCDILGKYTCLMDWQLAHLVTGEYYCPTIVAMVRHAIERVVQNAEGIQKHEPESVAAVMEALVLTGIAMSFVGNSRPASGSEHHMSHYWEMLFLLAGERPILHGITVGMGTVISSYLYHSLSGITPDFDEAKCRVAAFDRDAWEQNMRRTFSKAAPAVIALEARTQKNGPDGHACRSAAIQEHWTEILQLAEEYVPQTDEIIRLLTLLGAPTAPAQRGISHQAVVDGIIVAKEVRDRYTILQLLWDLGLLEDFANHAGDWLGKFGA